MVAVECEVYLRPKMQRATRRGEGVLNTSPETLGQLEAIALAYTLVARAAELVKVRILAIKGLVSFRHGLRPARTPADIDVLIEPSGFASLTTQLEAWGWRSRLGEFTDLITTEHSVTYVHDLWPCDIDAHRYFPGLLASPMQAFDALWERREYLTVAGHLVPMVDWAGSVTLMALHSVRSTPDNPRHVGELRALLDLSSGWTVHQREDLAALATRTGCAQSLGSVWQSLGVHPDIGAEEVSLVDLADWRLRVDGHMPHMRYWLRYVRAGSPRQVLSRVGTALWPPEVVMRAGLPVGDGEIDLLLARLRRLLRSAWRLPQSLFQIVRGGATVSRQALGGHSGPAGSQEVDEPGNSGSVSPLGNGTQPTTAGSVHVRARVVVPRLLRSWVRK